MYESLLDPPPPIPREYTQKAYFMNRLFDSGDLPADPEWANRLTNPRLIMRNHSDQYPDDSEFRQTLADHLKPKQADPFTVADTAAHLADLVFEDLEKPDMLDLALTVRAYSILSFETTYMVAADDQERQRRAGVLRRAFFDEAISRTDDLKGEAIVSLPSLYERVFKKRESADLQQLLVAPFVEAQLKIRDHLTLSEMLIEGDFFGPDIPMQRRIEQNPYNLPYAPEERTALNKEAAETIERLHLLKAYRVAPMIVPAATTRLPWDILMMPPLDRNLAAYDEGSLADFYFTAPRSEHAEATFNLTPIDSNGQFMRLDLGDEMPYTRFRLHDNGQISFGRLHINVPADFTEQLFANNYCYDAFVRLRGLLIALAFDALAPAEVIEKNIGGSVASRLQRAMAQSPGQDPFLKMLLPRSRELRRQGVTPDNRQPRDWELPRKEVDGYTRKLPEGALARPEAEEEAREFFESIRVNFDGLLPGMNFVKGYARGTGPEKTTFRRAIFNDNARTGRFLGNLGLR